MNNYLLEPEIKIRNVQSIWKIIDKEKKPILIDCQNLQKVDGSGFQLLLYLLKLENDFPEVYSVDNIPADIIKYCKLKGYTIVKGETRE